MEMEFPCSKCIVKPMCISRIKECRVFPICVSRTVYSGILSEANLFMILTHICSDLCEYFPFELTGDYDDTLINPETSDITKREWKRRKKLILKTFG
jgi:hypothetical protein